jgi:glycosyltransferase involved in cell wall biosynthesis
MRRVVHVCFVLPHAYALFDPVSTDVFGGSEVRGWLFGTELAQQSGYLVTFLVLASGMPRTFTCGHARVHTYAPDESAPRRSSSRSILDMMRRLIGRSAHGGDSRHPVRTAVQQIGADVYCAFGASDFTGSISGYCRDMDRPMVLFSGSDEDFSRLHRRGAMSLNQYGSTGDGAWRAITGARLIVTQTRRQGELLKSRFGKTGITIGNPIRLEKPSLASPDSSGRDYALWIGKADSVKRPDVVVEVARSSPDLRFVMVMNPVDRAIWNRIVDGKPANLVIHEYLPFLQAEGLFERAWVLLNTSMYEGFPNTFLQAGKYGVPLVTAGVDPDGFITATGSGLVCQPDTAALVGALRRLHDDGGFWQTCSRAVAQYVADNHEITARVRELDAALRRLVRDGAGASGAGIASPCRAHGE